MMVRIQIYCDIETVPYLFSRITLDLVVPSVSFSIIRHIQDSSIVAKGLCVLEVFSKCMDDIPYLV